MSAPRGIGPSFLQVVKKACEECFYLSFLLLIRTLISLGPSLGTDESRQLVANLPILGLASAIAFCAASLAHDTALKFKEFSRQGKFSKQRTKSPWSQRR